MKTLVKEFLDRPAISYTGLQQLDIFHVTKSKFLHDKPFHAEAVSNGVHNKMVYAYCT